MLNRNRPGYNKQHIMKFKHSAPTISWCLVSVNDTSSVKYLLWEPWYRMSETDSVWVFSLVFLAFTRTIHQHQLCLSKSQVSPSPGCYLKAGGRLWPCPVIFSDGVPVWTVPKSPSGEQLKNGGLTPLQSAEPSPALRIRSPSHGAEVRSVTTHCQLSPLLSILLLFLSAV